MSRIGKKPIIIPSGVETTIAADSVTVKGPKGTLTTKLHPHVKVTLGEFEGSKALTIVIDDETLTSDRALWGLFRSLVANMVEGVTKGFEEKLEVIGIGFKVNVSGKKLVLDVGYSHEVEFMLPEGISASVEKNTLTITGFDKQLVGETAAQIRRVRKPEPYKGTGIKYLDETIRRKAGKAATKAAA